MRSWSEDVCHLDHFSIKNIINGMVSHEIWGRHALMHEFFKNAQILYVLEKLTRACFPQIALETILLPIQTAKFCTCGTKFLNTCHQTISQTFISCFQLERRVVSHIQTQEKCETF